MTVSEWRLSLKESVLPQVQKISAGADVASGKFAHLQKDISGLGSGISSATSGLGGMRSALLGVAAGVAAAFSVHAISEFSNECVSEFNNAAQSSAQLQASIISTGGVAGKTFKEMTSLAEDLQKVTLFDDDDTIAAESLLLTFKKVRGSVFNDAVPAIQDLATKMKIDLSAATKQVGKALEDPVRGVNVLRKSGVSFTEEQIKGIKKLVESGKLQEAQTRILTELNSQFGGSAKAAAEAGLGPMMVLKNQLGDIKERIGGAIVGLVNQYRPQIQAFITSIGNGVEWVIAHASEIKTVFVSLAQGIGVAAAAYGVIAIATKAYALYQGIVTIATGGWTAAQVALNAAFMANPIGITVVAIGALVAGISYAWKTSEGFRGTIMGLWSSIKQVFTNIGNFFKATFTPIFDTIAAIKDGRWMDAAKSAGKAVINLTPMGMVATASKVAGSAKESVGDAYKNGYKSGFLELRKENALDAAKSITNKSKDGMLADAFSKKPAADATGDKTKDVTDGLKQVSDGGKSQRILNVTINKMVDGITINAATLKESTSDIVSTVQDALIRALSGAESTIAVNG